jgi:hypothetical protein
MRSHTRTVISILVAWCLAVASLAAANECLALMSGKVLAELGPRAADVLQLAATDGTAINKGMAALLAARKNPDDDGGEHLRKIFDLLGNDEAIEFIEPLEKLRNKPGLETVIRDLGTPGDTATVGAQGVIRYTTNGGIAPSDIEHLEFPVPGTTRRADVLDKLGNVHDVKNLTFASYNTFTFRMALMNYLPQITDYERYANEAGKKVFIAFPETLPPTVDGGVDYAGIFNDVLGEIADRGVVTFRFGGF